MSRDRQRELSSVVRLGRCELIRLFGGPPRSAGGRPSEPLLVRGTRRGPERGTRRGSPPWNDRHALPRLTERDLHPRSSASNSRGWVSLIEGYLVGRC